MQQCTLLIDETPYCFLDWELDLLDRQFIDGIDPSYFSYMAESNASYLDGDDSQRAALALRMTYSHAQETLMSLLCAAIQAPDCVIGWLHKYRNDELDRVVRKIVRGEHVKSKLDWQDRTWAGLSSVIHVYLSLPDKEKEARIKNNFGTFWSRTAIEFLDEAGRREYNSIKHGLRARSGGFRIAFGVEATPGVPPLPEQMKPIGGSEFGSTFYVPEAIEGVEKCNLRITNSSRNWLPDSLAARINIIANSISNVLSYLKIVNGDSAEKQHFSWPQDMDIFNWCWKSPGVTSSSLNSPLTADNIQALSKQQILDTYVPDKL